MAKSNPGKNTQKSKWKLKIKANQEPNLWENATNQVTVELNF